MIRSFRREDIPAIAELWLKVFRRREMAASESVQEYFRKIFFDGPWQDASLPSLVNEEPDGGLVGFLGVIPRRMIFDGRPIRVAVASQLMVDERARSAYAAAKLMRKFFDGPQDLALTDGANDPAEQLWLSCGGSFALPYSLTWRRVLRPAQHFSLLLKERNWKVAAMGLGPLWPLMDAIVLRSRLRRYWLPEMADAALEKNPSDETLLWCIRHLSGSRALRPDYELDSFRWLMREAREKKIHGELQRTVVRSTQGEILGWYLYYVRPGDVSQVLQYGGRPKVIRTVLNCLFYQAWEQGAVAVSGRVEPQFARALARSRCKINLLECALLVHSRRRDVLNAIHQEDAVLTRLEGEWWPRFSDPEWSAGAHPSGEQIGDLSKRLSEFERLAVRS